MASAFFAGRYDEIVKTTFDAGADLDPLDLSFVVGALTFLGRVEDAQLCYDGARIHRRTLPPAGLASSGSTARRDAQNVARTETASRFFLGLAYARAGDFERGHRLLVQDARVRGRDADPWNVAFVFQGLACHRYFTGRYRAAARHALRALRAAHVAHFGYVQMLANDLRGHAFVQLGHYRAGVALLEQAKVHSERLGFGMNAYAIECSIADYGAEFVARPEALLRIEALLKRRSHDWYSKRALLSASATQLALHGRSTEAMAALDEADADALRSGARRAKLKNLIARLHVLRLREGASACAEVLAQASELAHEGDIAFRAELLGFDAFVGHALGDQERRRRATEALRALAASSEHYRARAALEQLEDEPTARTRAFPEDEITPLLHAVITRDVRVLPRLLDLGLLGPIPELLGLTPSRRLLLLRADNALLVEDHGDVHLKLRPPPWCVALLGVFAQHPSGATKEAIVRALWGLRSYKPDRHDPLIRTTIHRLRAFLAPYGSWIQVTGDGYGTSAPVHFVGALSPIDLEAPLLEGEAPQPFGDRSSVMPASAGDPRRETRDQGARFDDDGPEARVFEKLARMQEPLSSAELAYSTGVSESTVLRALRVLLQKKKARRMGHARSTRYEAIR